MAEAATLRAKASDDQALTAHLKLQIEKLRREKFGPGSERSARLLDQLGQRLEGLAAEQATARTGKVTAFTRWRPSRKPFPEHLPRERVIVPGPTACFCPGRGPQNRHFEPRALGRLRKRASRPTW